METTHHRKMYAQEIYATAVGSLFAVFLGWQVAIIGDALRQRSMQAIRKIFVQTLVVTRRNGTSDYTVASTLAIVLLITGNLAVLFVEVADWNDMRERLRSVFHVNLIPLYVSARTPILSEFMFGLTYKQHSLIHRWIGWMCLFQGLGHNLLSLSMQQWIIKSYRFGVGQPSRESVLKS